MGRKHSSDHIVKEKTTKKQCKAKNTPQSTLNSTCLSQIVPLQIQVQPTTLAPVLPSPIAPVISPPIEFTNPCQGYAITR